ncbi:MAG: ABC transporter substrate-binding protein [Candidatus Berkiellales bacterium]
MKKLTTLILMTILLLVSGCNQNNEANQIKFAVSPEYPPFEYLKNGELHGFDIDLAKLIAQELGKKAVFEEMQFSTIIPAVQNKHVDVGISTITVTDDRKKQIDFSEIYFVGSIAVVFKATHPVTALKELQGKKIACQLGSVMEIWAKQHGFSDHLIAMDSNIQIIEALKAGHVDVALMDGVQGILFSKKNPSLATQTIDQSEEGYAVVLPKGSVLLAEINQALKNLKAKGEIAKLEEKWLKGELP